MTASEIVKLLAAIAGWISVYLLKTLVGLIKDWNKSFREWKEKTDKRLDIVEMEIMFSKKENGR